MNKLFNPFSKNTILVLGAIRIIIGLLMVYHGQEIFNSDLMQEYLKWDVFQNKFGVFLVYVGKGSELTAGILLTLGLFTRIGGLLLFGTMCYITFFVGNGHFWYEDQHPFLFALFGLLYLLTGSGAYSLDTFLYKKGETNQAK
jgi:putative oxidoreductase